MSKFLELLNGNKTYIIAAVSLVVIFLNIVEVITMEQMNTLLALLGTGGLASLRHGQQKAENAAVKAVDKAEVAVVAAEKAVVKAEVAVEAAK